MKDKTNGCKNDCILDYNHEGDHNCGEKHYCKNECYLKGKALGCKDNCTLEYPHEGKEHNCGKRHLCKEDCNLKNEAKNCGEKCTLEYPHEGKEHICSNKHYCKNDCYLKGKALGCEDNCTLEYPHEGKEHNCGKRHLCKEDCNLKNEAKNCGEKCTLEYPHEGKEHICSNKHYCKNDCSLKDKSIQCNGKCTLEYSNKNECICDLEKHECNGKCQINISCNNNCSLPAGHQGRCLCGRCTCPVDCLYRGISRNCNGICHLKGGHEGKHLCEIEEHFCNKICIYRGFSINCYEFCHYILEFYPNHNNHICEFNREMHKCSGTCLFYGISKECTKNCNFLVGHEGDHLCNSTKHSCNHICDIKDNAKNCKENCKEYIENNNTNVDHNFKEKYILFKNHREHLCSLKKEEHKCKKKCKLSKEPEIICDEDCSLKFDHEGECVCSKGREHHICNHKCDYYDNAKIGTCKKYCKLNVGHTIPHNCLDQHKCKGVCFLNTSARGCKKECSLPYPHQGDCICIIERNKHLCNENCSLKDISRGCDKGFKCHKEYGHLGTHLCKSSHFCNKDCYYYSKIRNRVKCKKKCCLPYNHPESKCICSKEPYIHPCDNDCNYRGISGGCNQRCKLDYGHSGKCMCYIKEIDQNPHKCIEKCEICSKICEKKEIECRTECSHVYNHNNENSLFCNYCKGICKLSMKGHLCNIQHDCPEKCKIDGQCCIEPIVDPIESTYQTILGDTITYKTIVKRKMDKDPCNKKIPNNEFSHSGGHICREGLIHKCGYECKQCGFNCSKPYGHGGLHKCEHGNIKNSSFSIINSSNTATIQKDSKSYEISEGDSAIIYVCNGYCIEQGQGHTHLVHKNEVKVINNDVRYFNDNYYECKCSYFWEYILQFETTFSPEEKKRFSLCNIICQDDKHKEYCQRELWHGSDIPNRESRTWVSPQGHKFNCNHPNGVYTIFLVDQSGSMDDSKIKPSNLRKDIQNKMNYMLGAAIEAILNYCQNRFAINPRELCALIGYSDDASLIFKNFSVGDEKNIKDKCLSELYPSGNTYFIKAFKVAKNILEEINSKKEFIPVIILLNKII